MGNQSHSRSVIWPRPHYQYVQPSCSLGAKTVTAVPASNPVPNTGWQVAVPDSIMYVADDGNNGDALMVVVGGVLLLLQLCLQLLQLWLLLLS